MKAQVKHSRGSAQAIFNNHKQAWQSYNDIFPLFLCF